MTDKEFDQFVAENNARVMRSLKTVGEDDPTMTEWGKIRRFKYMLYDYERGTGDQYRPISKIELKEINASNKAFDTAFKKALEENPNADISQFTMKFISR